MLIVDEAQALGPGLLEQVRRLTNLETARHKLLGSCWWASRSCTKHSPGLICANWRNELPHVATWDLFPARRPASTCSTGSRWPAQDGKFFSSRARRLLYRLSKGIPRIINVVADRALLGAFVCEEPEVGARLVRLAAREVYGREGAPTRAVWSGATG